ncbi:hypothetical protein [Candidatus Symbiobacter mobilis]|uniref:Uncharacterized protein n=1 Tax=Candidatus Symbiobacter mobilis CR TaxID=946483 RepID=U5NC84_9BURK|nr:hypothetical protein [Candidatus Symbiobacter mobilis]AGX87799.1 hypothetical protein Cenrod_1714 [Candidatus Symbiobacter mobilis CR]
MRYLLLIWCSVWALAVHAGTISYAVDFLPTGFSVRNTGSQPAYALTAWTLDATGWWKQGRVVEGDPATLSPGAEVRWSRPPLPPGIATAIHQADPLLLVFFDAAGSRFAQVAWRVPPGAMASPLPPLPVKREGSALVIDVPAQAAGVVATSAIRLADPGVVRLTRPFAGHTPPPYPARHVWKTGAAMRFDTGQGLRGAWLVHELASGELRVQIVPDARTTGSEQRTRWLEWARSAFGWIAAACAVVGALGMVWGTVTLRRNPV